MKKIYIRPIGTLSEKRIARMLALELEGRGCELSDTPNGASAAVFVADIPDGEELDEIMRMSELLPTVLLRHDLEEELGGVLTVERPFDTAMLCDAVMRLCQKGEMRARSDGGLVYEDGEFHFRGEKLSLTKKENALLELLYENRGSVLDRSTLQAVFGDDGESNVVDVYIRYLREKLDLRFDERMIVTVRNRGYMLK